MDMVQRVFLCGNSVILGSLGISLRRHPQFEVTELTPPLPGSRDLTALNPDVVVFDLKTVHKESLFSLLESCPGLLLVGISPDTNLVKMWSGWQMNELSTRGLLEAINVQLKSSYECLDKEVEIKR